MYTYISTGCVKYNNKMNAEEHKQRGNSLYASKKYHEAATCYTRAIQLNSNVSSYFTNRALCRLKLRQWDSAIQDCRQALELNSDLVKGHFFLGQAQLELKNFDEAIASLQRAHELAKDFKLHYGDDITAVLRLARRKRFAMLEDKRIQQEIELQSFLHKLIEDERERSLLILRENTTEDDDSETDVKNLEKSYDKRIEEVNALFRLVDERRKRRDVPDFLCGKISFELLKEPVITPSGITYDKKDLEEHLQRVGHFDPVTRAPLVQEQLIPNLAMKEVVDAFLEENPWAEDI